MVKFMLNMEFIYFNVYYNLINVAYFFKLEHYRQTLVYILTKNTKAYKILEGKRNKIYLCKSISMK